ncbi:TniQ family protein [Pseudomonas mohnii]
MDRLLFFPEPLPDESLYSLAVRYHRLAANNSYRRTSQELFGTYSRTCGSVLPCCLGALSQRLCGQYSVTELVDARTLLPLYRPFLSVEVYESAIRCMQSTQGTGMKMSLGMTASRLLKFSSFRYCEACIKHDVDEFGVAYWHRIHMAVGVCICPHHGKVLLRAIFPEDADWRCMFLPGESSSEPVLGESSMEAASTVAKMQFWGLSNPQNVCDLVRNDFLRRHLTKLGMFRNGRLMEKAVSSYVEHRLSHSTRDAEFLIVTTGSDWVMRLLRRRRRIIQPFRYYFLYWLLGVTADDLYEFRHQAILGANDGIPCNKPLHPIFPMAEKTKFRHAFKVGENSNSYVRGEKVHIDEATRDINLAGELLAARDKIIDGPGKPKKVTKSALFRRVSNHYGELRDTQKFPRSMEILKKILETGHDYQIRKISWAIKKFSLSGHCAVSVIMRLAGIRVRLISELEIRKLLDVNLSSEL